jgi:hypothetical protein
MKRLSVIVVLLVVASWLAYIAVGQPSLGTDTRPQAVTLFRGSCDRDGDTLARIRDEVITYARDRRLSEEEFSRRLGASRSQVEELACASEVSGNSVPSALLALEDFNAFVTAKGPRGAAGRISRWAALCQHDDCAAVASKLQQELSIHHREFN